MTNAVGQECRLDQGFREAMRRLAGTVTVVTVDNNGERHGTTATAVTSLSMSPPSLLVCFNRDSRLHGLLSGTKVILRQHPPRRQRRGRTAFLASGLER